MIPALIDPKVWMCLRSNQGCGIVFFFEYASVLFNSWNQAAFSNQKPTRNLHQWFGLNTLLVWKVTQTTFLRPWCCRRDVKHKIEKPITSKTWKGLAKNQYKYLLAKYMANKLYNYNSNNKICVFDSNFLGSGRLQSLQERPNGAIKNFQCDHSLNHTCLAFRRVHELSVY